MAILLQSLALQARHRHRPRPRPGLPRPLLAAGELRALGAVRDRDRRLRPRRGDRLRHRAQPAVRHPAGAGASCLTALDVLLILLLQNKGFRWLEALVIALIATIGVCFARRARCWRSPDWRGVARGLRADAREIVANPAMLYIAIGILGATVMPHNLYLHSSIVQTRRVAADAGGQARGDPLRHHRLAPWRCCFALFINAAILILAAADVPRHRPHRGGRDPGRLPAAHAAARRRRWPARCSRWRCWRRARTRPSPARWPARS